MRCSPLFRQLPAGGALPPQLNLAVESWIEFEEAALRPAVYGGSSDAVAAAVQRVKDGLGGSKRFLAGSGSQPSLADLVVYATLSPLAGAWVLLLLLRSCHCAVGCCLSCCTIWCSVCLVPCCCCWQAQGHSCCAAVVMACCC